MGLRSRKEVAMVLNCEVGITVQKGPEKSRGKSEWRSCVE
jgi:hypothetical protein